MTDDQINVTIAECCGWRFDGRDTWTSPDGHEYQALYGSEYKYGTPLPPRYSTDLNAMHEAERILPTQDRPQYQHWLDVVCAPSKDPHCSCWDFVHATARQRAEAFLRLKGLWKP